MSRSCDHITPDTQPAMTATSRLGVTAVLSGYQQLPPHNHLNVEKPNLGNVDQGRQTKCMVIYGVFDGLDDSDDGHMMQAGTQCTCEHRVSGFTEDT